MALLEVRDLGKRFSTRRTFGRRRTVWAVRGVSFDVEEGEMFGLVGESGSGKTTLARSIVRLVEPTSGEVRFKGRDVLRLSKSEMRGLRREVQVVFQDPWGSLNPRMRAGAIVEEPLVIHGMGDRAGRRERVEDLFRQVGLDPAWQRRYPDEFSGGQRQRLGIARALALSPSLVIADEAVSALDVSVQAQVINLLMDLQERLSLTYLFIAHDLRLVEHVCSRVAVMFRGRIVEMGPVEAVFARPAHPYTRALLSAIPVPDPRVATRRVPFDEALWDAGAPLVGVGDGHLAAGGTKD